MHNIPASLKSAKNAALSRRYGGSGKLNPANAKRYFSHGVEVKQVPDPEWGVCLSPRKYKKGDRVHYRSSHGLRGFGRITAISPDAGPNYLVKKERWPDHEIEEEWFYGAQLYPDATTELREKFNV